MLPNWAITFLVVFALTSSIALLIYMLFFYRGLETSTVKFRGGSIFGNIPDFGELWEYILSLARQLQLHREVLRHVKARVILAVALVQHDSRFVLCNLASGPFEGCWGFPAGYVEAGNPEAAEQKATYEVRKYLGEQIDITFLGELNASSKPLVLYYAELMPVEVHVFRYSLVEESIDFDTTNVRVVRQREIEKIEAVNPLVFDVLGQLTDTVFSAEFADRMGQVKEESARILPLQVRSNRRA